jgi:hypothetical protein
MSLELAADIVGYIGSGLIVLAYLLLQTGRVHMKSVAYSLINLTGATLLMLSLLVHTNMPSIAIEMFWIAISLYGLCRALANKNDRLS